MAEMDPLSTLRLLVEWGADEALDDVPLDRFRPAPAAPARPLAQAAAPLARVAAAASVDVSVAAASLDELHAALLAFDGCALKATSTHTVRPDGNPAAGLVLISDAPGADDDRSGLAFSGAPGATLDRLLRPAGLDRTMMLLATLVPWRPPGNRPLSDAEVQACLPFLHRLLVLTRPRHLVLLGTGPVRALTGNAEPIRRLRGRWMEATIPGLDAPVPALPLPQLDQWLRSPSMKRDVWRDLLQVRSVITNA